jgi:cysteine desulfurase family protein
MTIYLDNAATSWPKHPVVLAAMQNYLETAGGNPGRSGHSMSVAAARIVFDAREQLARLFNAASADWVVFSKNATEAINYILFGLLTPDDHVITTGMEHNAVMRPLRRLESLGTKLTVVPCDACGQLDPGDVINAITSQTKLIIMTHASNVSGTILPVAAVGRIAREHGVLFAVDAAQTAGSVSIDLQAANIDLLAFTGHKGLGGPQGTGGLALSPAVTLPPLLYGGTGSLSESEYQPDFLPDRLESGTLNAIGIAGLGAAVAELNETGVATITAHKQLLVRKLLAGLAAIPAVEIYGPHDARDNAGVVSINVSGLVCSEVGLALDRVFGIMTRTGLHCAPAAHKTLGTFPQGTVRLSVSRFTTTAEIDQVLDALAQIAAGPGDGDG